MMILQSINRILVFCFIWIIVLSTLSLSQSHESKNVVYVEACGAAILYSVNYERFISNDFTIRVGYSILPFSHDGGREQGSYFLAPILVNYLLGTGNNKLEIGAGIDLFSTGSGTFVILVGSLGLRYQPSDGGFHFRLVAVPMFSPYTEWNKLWFGTSFGICF